MGYAATAYTIIGINLKHSNFYITKQVRGCKHPATKANFCSECGQPTWEDKEFPLSEYDSDERELAGFRLIAPNCDSDYSHISGKTLEPGDHLSLNDLSWLKPIHDAMKAKLEPLGFWDEDSFGIHTVLYESY